MQRQQNGDTKDFTEAVNKIQKLFYDYYDETKKILIATERFGDFSNVYVFYNMFMTLEKMYLIAKKPTPSEILNNINEIEINFLIAQSYSMAVSISELKQQLDRIDPRSGKKLEKAVDKIKSILINSDLVKKDESGEINFRTLLLLDIDTIKKNKKRFIKINNAIKSAFREGITAFIPKWKIDVPSTKNHKLTIKKLDKSDYIKLYDVLCGEYWAARKILFDLLRRRGAHYYFATADLRDAVDHIAKSLCYDECNTYIELCYAAEHIRRAAMESLQTYVESKLDRLNKSLRKHRGSKELEKIIISLFKAKQFLNCGRYFKANETWYKSIEYFYDGLERLEKLEDQLDRLELK